MKNFLSEFFQAAGTDAQEFFDLCKDLDGATTYVKAKSPVLSSFVMNDEEAGKLSFTDNNFVSFGELETALNDANEGEKIYDELKNSRGPMVDFGSYDKCIIGNKAVAEIAALRGLHGTPLNKPSKARDAYINELASGLNVTFVGRKAGNVVRVLSTRSGKYGAIPMTTVKSVYDGFMSSDWIGSYEVKEWAMNQDRGAIYIEFPDLAANMRTAYPNLPENWVPGVIFENGTTGYCTLGALMTYRRETSDHTMVVDRVFAKHFAGFTPDTFIKKMQNECWGKYTQLPEKLEAATQVDVDPVFIESLLEKIFKFIKLNKVFQKKDTETCKYLEKIRDTAKKTIEAIAAIQDLTLYDFIKVIMDIPDSVVVPDAYKELLKETCERAWMYEA